jgi:hypothetical protein
LAFCLKNPHRDRGIFKVFLVEVKHHIVTFFNLRIVAHFLFLFFDL